MRSSFALALFVSATLVSASAPASAARDAGKDMMKGMEGAFSFAYKAARMEMDGSRSGTNQPLPYSMQPGSGTFDLLPGISYRGRAGAFSWGGQIGGVLRLGRNDAVLNAFR